MDELEPEAGTYALQELRSIAHGLRMNVEHMICHWMTFGRVLAADMAGMHDRVEFLMRVLVRLHHAAMQVCDYCRARIECERVRRAAWAATNHIKENVT